MFWVCSNYITGCCKTWTLDSELWTGSLTTISYNFSCTCKYMDWLRSSTLYSHIDQRYSPILILWFPGSHQADAMGTWEPWLNLESESPVTDRQWRQNRLVPGKHTELITSYIHIYLKSTLDIWSLLLACSSLEPESEISLQESRSLTPSFAGSQGSATFM